ncbi:MAG: PQQ-binding-like beta-propeller repeat protein [Eggerthellaceae bacterium]|nr:PQQ-binding-like beta-propeller repeat protein [Eggerthellaceae bacterium]
MKEHIVSAVQTQQSRLQKRILQFFAIAFSLVIACAVTPAALDLTSAVAFAEDANREVKSVITVRIIGMDEAGNPQDWTGTVRKVVPEGSNAGDLTVEVIEEAGLSVYVDYSGGFGGFLSYIVGPDGKTYSYDPATGSWWQFIVNGELASRGAWTYEVQPGDEIVWYFVKDSSTLPPEATGQTDPLVSNEGVNGPSEWTSEWSGFAQSIDTPQGTDVGAVITSDTPTECAKALWEFNSTEESQSWITTDPLLAGDSIYVGHGTKFYRLDKSTGKVLASTDLHIYTDYTVRPVYANGFIYVPLTQGMVQALSADTLETAWVSQPLGNEDMQSSTSLVYNDGSLYLGIAYATDTWDYTQGVFASLDAQTGEISWATEENPDSGFYWNGAAVVGDTILVADAHGVVHSFDKATGKELRALDLKANNSSDTLVNASQDRAYVATKDGVLHVLDISKEVPEQITSIPFAEENASTPAIVDNVAIALGRTHALEGILSIIDLTAGEVTKITTADGENLPNLNATPLVAKQQDGVYVYFVGNSALAEVYVYKLGDSEAHVLYTPEASKSSYADSPLIADKDGIIYYLNDSGWLFALSKKVSSVIYKDEDGSVLQDAVTFGGCETEPAYIGETPTKEEDETYTYTFSSWERDVDAVGNITYTAQYAKKLKQQEQPSKEDETHRTDASDDGDNAGTTVNNTDASQAPSALTKPTKPTIPAQTVKVWAKTADAVQHGIYFALLSALGSLIAIVTVARVRKENDQSA